MMRRITVIGGGASGLMAAISAAGNTGSFVTVIEKNQRPARKLMITGKGRCNVTNNSDADNVIKNIPKNGRFLYSVFSRFSPKDTMEFFENCGVPLKTERGNRVFPVSDKAVDIVDALVNKAKSLNVKIIESSATEILCKNGRVFAVRLEDNTEISSDSVIISTGGMSYPLTGSTGDGYKFAKDLGHTVTEIYPSLVPLECHEGFCSNLSGLSLKNITASFFYEGDKKPVFEEQGELLFTHFGISGPLTLSASAHLRDIKNKNCYCLIDLKPALTAEQLDKRLIRDFSDELNKDFSNSLGALLPKSLIPIIVKLSGIAPDIKVNQITKEQRQILIKLIKQFKLHIIGTRPIEEAIITSGGVSVKEIDPKTMQSKLINGLFFAGEVIDVDAYTGGYNLQIAFSTGYVAGINAAKERN
ncbi:MAG: NAD(P)/FAD-dependent oxidoreductase [Clostridia bacterium]|nr:NAD(P)/FAD-dependent oxidoreductase [Clostridia bacterium]